MLLTTSPTIYHILKVLSSVQTNFVIIPASLRRPPCYNSLPYFSCESIFSFCRWLIIRLRTSLFLTGQNCQTEKTEGTLLFYFYLNSTLTASVHCNITNELIGVINQTLSALRYWPHSSRHFLNIRAEINWAEKCISYSEM